MDKYGKYVKKYKRYFILGPIFMIIEACGEFILPYINANIIDYGAANGDIQYILENGMYMVAIALIMLVTGVLGAYFAINGASKLSMEVRRDVFEKIQTFSFSNIDSFSTGSLITRITNDITQIQTFTTSLLRGFLRSPIMLIGAIVMSFMLNPDLALVICVVMPILLIVIVIIIRVASPRYTTMQKKIDNLNSNIEETVTNERVIKSFVREDYEKEKFSKVNHDLKEKSVNALKMMILITPISNFAINFTTLAVVWIAGRQIMIGSMEIGTLTAFITYLTQVLTSLNFLANIFLQGTRAYASDKRISEVLNAKVDLTDDDAKEKDYIIQKGDIEFKDVSFKYFKHNKEQVLDHINIHIQAGEFVGIIGSTGSGKTTLVSLIPRLYDCDEGAVYVDGRNVKDLSLYQLRESVSMVLQQNTLFSGTISENLRWGKEDASDQELIDACRIAQADSFIQSFPDKYETDLNQGGLNLSGGQKQRLCIARGLLKDPKILILDDSTSAVDTATDAKIRKAFKENLKDMTKIMITQRIGSVMDADRIIVLDEGKVVGVGQHEDLMRDCQTYQEIYYSQKDKEEA